MGHTAYRRFAAIALVAGLLIVAPGAQARSGSAAASIRPGTLVSAPVAGFTSRFKTINGVHMHYVIGGTGAPVVLLHGYGSTWYEWRDVMPALAQRHTVIVPDLPGLGDSGISTAGYDGATIASDLYRLVQSLTATPVDLVAHDIGVWVAYPYAAAHPHAVRRLVLMEAPIPDKSLYTFPAFTPQGEGVGWHFGFFSSRAIPEELIGDHTRVWLAWFYREHADPANYRAAFPPATIDEYTRHYAVPASLHASFEYYRAMNTDIAQNAMSARTKLPMPVLALGADHSLGGFEEQQLRGYATDVRGGVVLHSGHWIPEEQPTDLARRLLAFLA